MTVNQQQWHIECMHELGYSKDDRLVALTRTLWLPFVPAVGMTIAIPSDDPTNPLSHYITVDDVTAWADTTGSGEWKFAIGSHDVVISVADEHLTPEDQCKRALEHAKRLAPFGWEVWDCLYDIAADETSPSTGEAVAA